MSSNLSFSSSPMWEIHQEDSDVVDVLVSKKRESLLTHNENPPNDYSGLP
jgi:hypothetical protein